MWTRRMRRPRARRFPSPGSASLRAGRAPAPAEAAHKALVALGRRPAPRCVGTAPVAAFGAMRQGICGARRALDAATRLVVPIGRTSRFALRPGRRARYARAVLGRERGDRPRVDRLEAGGDPGDAASPSHSHGDTLARADYEGVAALADRSLRPREPAARLRQGADPQTLAPLLRRAKSSFSTALRAPFGDRPGGYGGDAGRRQRALCC